ncbi:MAG: ParB N-terminal domain-containing protein [Syntrophus sp. (in: bacteria)]
MEEWIPISQIDRPPETQPRTAMDMLVIAEYAEVMKAGTTFPPADVFKVEDRYVLVDGFHRIEAAVQAQIDTYLCEVHEGTMRDAFLFASGVNAAHGLRRTPEDKHRAVERLLADAEWSQWNDSTIAEKCRVSHSFVSKVRQISFHGGKIPDERKVKRGTKTYTMSTAKIGKQKTAKKPVSKEHASLPESSSPIANVVDAASTLPISPVFSTETCKTGKCPDGKTHYIMNSRRNRMECDLIGVEITQLPKNDCPWLVQQRKVDAAKSMITTDAAEQCSNAKQEEMEAQPLPLNTTPPQQPPINNEENGAIDPPIESGMAEPVTDVVPEDAPDAPLECIQHNIVPSVQVSDKPWTLPTRQLSQDEWNEFFADFVRVACTVEQQQLITALIANGKFANEMALVDYALDLVGKLDKKGEGLKALKDQPFTPGQILKCPLDIQWFAPVFPIVSLESTNYHRMHPDVLVLSVFVEVVYYLKPGGLP